MHLGLRIFSLCHLQHAHALAPTFDIELCAQVPKESQGYTLRLSAACSTGYYGVYQYNTKGLPPPPLPYYASVKMGGRNTHLGSHATAVR